AVKRIGQELHVGGRGLRDAERQDQIGAVTFVRLNRVRSGRPHGEEEQRLGQRLGTELAQLFRGRDRRRRPVEDAIIAPRAPPSEDPPRLLPRLDARVAPAPSCEVRDVPEAALLLVVAGRYRAPDVAAAAPFAVQALAKAENAGVLRAPELPALAAPLHREDTAYRRDLVCRLLLEKKKRRGLTHAKT